MQIEDIAALTLPAIQQYIFENETLDAHKLVLQQREILGQPVGLIASQIISRKKARLKLPTYYQTSGIIYPAGLSLEQSSSEMAAEDKLEWVKNYTSDRTCLIDLSGGFGVDSYLFSKWFERVIYIEPNSILLEIARHNHRVLGRSNISHLNTTAEDFLATSRELASVVYIDPSRRDHGNRKMSAFQDCEPDITKLKHSIFLKADLLMVKAAPLLDIKAAAAALEQNVIIRILAIDNDCKELNFLVSKHPPYNTSLEAVNISALNDEPLKWTPEIEEAAQPRFSEPEKYLYEPNVAIMKGGAFRWVSQKFNLAKLGKSTHLYTSNEVDLTFPGKVFAIQSVLKSDAASARTLLPDRRANIVLRNYPMTVEELKRKLKISEGGQTYLIGTSTPTKKYLLVCNRLR